MPSKGSLAQATLVLIAALALAASALAQESAAPPQGGIVRIALASQPETLNPVLIGEISSSIVNAALFTPLTRMSPRTFDIEPYLAERWESNAELTEWTFYLRPDALWHDGQPVTADDVKFTFERIMDPAQSAANFRDVEDLQSVDVIDAHTVRFVLSRPNGLFPDLLSLGSLEPLPKHLFEGFERLTDAVEFNTRNPIGSGPFRFKSAETGSYVELEAFDDFFLGRPNVDGLLFSIIPDINVRVARLRAGELDWIDIDAIHVASLANDARFEVVHAGSSRYQALDLGYRGPAGHLWADPRVRIAMNHAIDKELILETVALGYGSLMGPHLVPSWIDWVPAPDIESYAYDPERARQLMAEAGWTPNAQGILEKDGEPFAFYILVDRGNTEREQIGLVVQDALRAIGMDVEYVLAERTGRWIQEVRENVFPARMTEHPTPHPIWFTRIWHSNGVFNRGYSNPEADALLDQTALTADREEQGRLFQRAQEIIYASVPNVTFHLRDQLLAVNTRLEGVGGEIKLSMAYSNELYFEPR